MFVEVTCYRISDHVFTRWNLNIPALSIFSTNVQFPPFGRGIQRLVKFVEFR